MGYAIMLQSESHNGKAVPKYQGRGKGDLLNTNQVIIETVVRPMNT